jgi:hypothetical protein
VVAAGVGLGDVGLGDVGPFGLDAPSLVDDVPHPTACTAETSARSRRLVRVI